LRVLVDSCGWVAYLADGPLAGKFAPLLKRIHDVVVPTVVQYEVYKWVCREREETLALRVVGHMEQGVVRPLDTRVALLAADISRERGLAMADAIVYAHARLEDVKLVTSDKHFQGLPGVVLHGVR
jgi:predicted nucleic acid-binding protein